METYERLPLWLRWILFLPLSILFSFLIVFILALLRADFEFIHSAAVIISFSCGLYLFAPRWKIQMIYYSLILRMLYSTGMILLLVFVLGEIPDKTTIFEIFRELFGWVVGWIFYFKLSEELL